MGLVRLRTRRDAPRCVVTVEQQEAPNEEPGKIIELEVGPIPTRKLTPLELGEMGEWMVRQAEFIERNFHPDGRPRQLPEDR